MEVVHLIIVVPLAVWLGARIGRKAPWSTRRALVALFIVVPLALAVGVPTEQVVVDAMCLGVGFSWVRRPRRHSGEIVFRCGERPEFISTRADAAPFRVGPRVQQAAAEPTLTAAIRLRRREEMASVRAQRKGKKAPIF